MRWRSLLDPAARRGAAPPPPKRMVDAGDVAYRAYCAQRAMDVWLEDRSLEGEELRALWTPFKGFLKHVFILICVNLTGICRLDRFVFLVHDALEDAYLNNHFEEGPVQQMIVFSEVDTVERLWSFTDFLLDSMSDDDPIGVTPENLLVGKVRLRQVRVQPGPCLVWNWPELAGDFDRCYGFFGAASEDTQPFGPSGPSGPSGPGTAAAEAWTYRTHPDGAPTYGYLATYPPDGYWADLPRDVEEAKAVVESLKNSSWIDAASRAVVIDLLTYNANVNMMCMTSITFELPPGSGVVPDLRVQCTALIQYATWFDMWRLGNEILFLVCTFVLTATETSILLEKRKDLGQLLGHYWSMWTLMSSLMLAGCWGVLWLGLRRHHEATVLLYALERDGLATPRRAEYLLYYEVGTQRCVAVVVFIAWLRTFQHHRVTTQVLVTLQRSRSDLASYFVMYVVLHCAFAQAGYYLFGDQVSSFKTFSESALAILAIALGEMRSDPILAVHPSTGSVFFILFIFIVVFVFHNMFFVILSYNYDSVREERSQLDRGLKFLAFIKNGYLNFMKWLGRPREVDPQTLMERRLIQCGFSPGSLQAFKAFLTPRPGIKTPQSHPGNASVQDLRVVEDIVKVMETELIHAKSELTTLVSSLSGELYGM